MIGCCWVVDRTIVSEDVLATEPVMAQTVSAMTVGPGLTVIPWPAVREIVPVWAAAQLVTASALRTQPVGLVTSPPLYTAGIYRVVL